MKIVVNHVAVCLAFHVLKFRGFCAFFLKLVQIYKITSRHSQENLNLYKRVCERIKSRKKIYSLETIDLYRAYYSQREEKCWGGFVFHV